jgi:hypothetical protein
MRRDPRWFVRVSGQPSNAGFHMPLSRHRVDSVLTFAEAGLAEVT